MTLPFNYLDGQALFRDAFVPFKDANVSIALARAHGLSVYTVFRVNWNEAKKNTTRSGSKIIISDW